MIGAGADLVDIGHVVLILFSTGDAGNKTAEHDDGLPDLLAFDSDLTWTFCEVEQIASILPRPHRGLAFECEAYKAQVRVLGTREGGQEQKRNCR